MTREQLGEMYEEYFSRIYNHIYFRVLSKELANDLVSSVFLKVVKSLDGFDESKASFKTWIYTIANNTLIDYYRCRKVEVALTDANEPTQSLEDQTEILQSEERRALYNALKTLDERARQIISLKYTAGMSIRDIAKMLNMNESTVSTLHTRGLDKLRKILSEDFFTE